MVNGDHAHPQHPSQPACRTCADRGWIDDRSTAARFVRRCPICEFRRGTPGPIGAPAGQNRQTLT